MNKKFSNIKIRLNKTKVKIKMSKKIQTNLNVNKTSLKYLRRRSITLLHQGTTIKTTPTRHWYSYYSSIVYWKSCG